MKVKSLTFQQEKLWLWICYSCFLKWTNIMSLRNTWIKTMTSYFNKSYQGTQWLSPPQRTLVILWSTLQELGAHTLPWVTPSPPESTGSRTSAENQEQRLQEHLLETVHLTRLTGLPEARLGGYCLSPAAIRDFFCFLGFLYGFLKIRWRLVFSSKDGIFSWTSKLLSMKLAVWPQASYSGIS